MSHWPGFDRERAMRLLTRCTCRPGLIVSRTHPAAIDAGWRGGRSALIRNMRERR